MSKPVDSKKKAILAKINVSFGKVKKSFQDSVSTVKRDLSKLDDLVKKAAAADKKLAASMKAAGAKKPFQSRG